MSDSYSDEQYVKHRRRIVTLAISCQEPFMQQLLCRSSPSRCAFRFLCLCYLSASVCVFHEKIGKRRIL